MILVAPDQAAKVLQPGEQPLDAPPPPVAAQGAAVLGRRAAPVRSVRGDQLNPALGGQARIQGVTVVGFVPDQDFGAWAIGAPQDDYPVWGTIALWGKVVEHDDGYRAEHAMIRRLVVPCGIVVRSAEQALGKVYLGDLSRPPDVEVLGRRYGVEVEVGEGIEIAA